MRKKLTIAVLTGGPGAERGIALLSAHFVADHLDRENFDVHVISIEPEGWYELDTHRRINLDNFSLICEQPVSFDFVFLMIHGTPAEDGKVQGYFEMLGIPHSTCDTLTCSLTFDKQWCKDYISSIDDVAMPPSQVVLSGNREHFNASTLNYPVFVKPNCNGSSYGISKVESASDLPTALDLAATFDDEIIIEGFIDGPEFSCGLLKSGDKIHVFPITEIVPQNVFFDYEAKYEGASQEITPARISGELTAHCQEISERLYRKLRCRGIVRFDYILVGDVFYFLEVNTIPGMSPVSIVPQQARAYGWSHERLMEAVVKDCMRDVPAKA